jgi:hypothetical protein
MTFDWCRCGTAAVTNNGLLAGCRILICTTTTAGVGANGDRFALAGGGVEILPLGTDIGHARAAAERGATRALARPAHAFDALGAAVGATAAVPLVSLQVDAPALAAGLGRSTTVAATTTVALVSLQVYAPVVTSGLPFGASVVGPGYPWEGGQGSS